MWLVPGTGAALLFNMIYDIELMLGCERQGLGQNPSAARLIASRQALSAKKRGFQPKKEVVGRKWAHGCRHPRP